MVVKKARKRDLLCEYVAGMDEMSYLCMADCVTKVSSPPGLMNIEDYRYYCLSMGTDVEERLPFQKFKSGEGVLVFYVAGHMFSFFDCNDFRVVSLKCQPERIDDLKAHHDCIGNPYNESPRHWIGVNPLTAPDDLLKELTRNSYEIVREKYTRKK